MEQTILCKILNSNPSTRMHILQPKHTKLNEKQAEELLNNFNISKSQLPKIFSTDPALPEGCNTGDIIKIERKAINPETNAEEINFYYRVVI